MSDQPPAVSGQNGHWFIDKGDDTRALEWDIGSNSLVWEIGGFEGRWAAQIKEKFHPFIEVFEPQSWAVDKLEARFGSENKIVINPYGLWVADAHLPLYNFETDGASLVGVGSAKVQICRFVDVYTALDGEVDLCLMNIEGAEFVLIPYMIGLGLMSRFRYFWCQFHTFFPDSDRRANQIYKAMSQTHKKIWDYYPTAVAWERK